MMRSQGADDEMYGLLFKEPDYVNEFSVALLDILFLRTVHGYDALKHGCVDCVRHCHDQY